MTNYGYHLDAGKFGELLCKHATEQLHVTHIRDNIVSVNNDSDGYISSVETEKSGPLEADLFIDCTGTRGILINQHYGVPFVLGEVSLVQ